ncbi:MAG TPA: pyruvate dehydrogenase complex dihydrolipoamide acetyltransferase, partial [Saprospiraceae bacterium]|nr:pyruvate dehydrogenase complex dihydrolipoamide acetyltransferase [Saprospiraceae bacterium]
MPRMSDTMEEGNIVSWLKSEGDSVEIGETLAEVETDKATMELDSPEEGVLLHIAVQEGAVPINGVIAVIGKKGEDWKAAIESSGSNGKAEEAKSAAAPATAEEKSSPAPVAESDHQPAPPSDDDKRVKASPLAKNLAKDAGIDIGQVEGSGDQGRIVKRDIEAAIEAQKSAPAPQPAPTPASKPAAQEAPAVTPFAYAPGTANFEEKAISQMRKTIARRLGESKFTAPHFYLTIDINMDKSVAMRKQVNEVAPTKISFNDFVVKAAAVALRQHPGVNSSWLGDKIRYNKDINIGVAVAVDEGLLVPVIRYADIKTLSQINTEVKHFAGKAKERKLQPDEMQGNTFTISNLGMFGIEEFTAIINPPDSCILAVGAIIEKPVVKNGEIAIANMMKVTLSCDHRTVDGAMGAQFLQTFKGILEDPIRLMV